MTATSSIASIGLTGIKFEDPDNMQLGAGFSWDISSVLPSWLRELVTTLGNCIFQFVSDSTEENDNVYAAHIYSYISIILGLMMITVALALFGFLMFLLNRMLTNRMHTKYQITQRSSACQCLYDIV